MRFLYILLLSITLLSADDSVENCSIDDSHKVFSQNILNTSKYIDKTLSDLFMDTNVDEDNDNSSLLKKDVESVDSFFKNEKFMDETDKSFIRVRASSAIQSIDEDNNKLSIKARLSLFKTKKHIKLFIEDDIDNEKKTDPAYVGESKINIGLSYLTPKYYGIDSKYSAGISGFYPYVSARYKIKYELLGWLIEPVQSFKYSINHQIFEEKTNIYFDTKIDNLQLFRVQLSRGTNSDNDGMYYGSSFIYFHATSKGAGLSISQSFSGNTKYTYNDHNDNLLSFRGISAYSTDLSWRDNIWKKWFFYEVRPGVDFARANDYKANYKVLFLTDFYFGYY